MINVQIGQLVLAKESVIGRDRWTFSELMSQNITKPPREAPCDPAVHLIAVRKDLKAGARDVSSYSCQKY